MSARIACLLLALVTAACAGPQGAPPGEPPQARATPGESAAVERRAAPAPALPTSRPAAEARSTAPKAPAKVLPPGAPAQAPAKEAPPSMDLNSLKSRLKDTNAIGFFTKVGLKNQVDGLLDQFRAFYQGNSKTTLADLRRPFDMLLLKVLALLQDADPPLARAIVASREALWGILSDPAKFSAL